jgi:hypothetical protein
VAEFEYFYSFKPLHAVPSFGIRQPGHFTSLRKEETREGKTREPSRLVENRERNV